MARHIDILFTGPPGIDFPTLVGAQDEHGGQVTVGKWVEPDADLPFWRFRLTPAELLAYLIADTEQPAQEPSERFIRRTPPLTDNLPGGILPTLSPRAALKAKLASAQPKSAAAPPTPDPLCTEPCPACRKLFNPALDQLIPCSACGEDKCTAKCFDSVADPCLDCQALAADPQDENDVAYSAPAKAEISDPAIRAAVLADQRAATQAVGGRLFDGTFHGKQGDSAAVEDD